MNFTQSVLIALEMLRQHKLRAFLTMLGVIIGVMSVTMIVMISNGFQAYLDSQFMKAGANTIMVAFDPGRRMHGATTGGRDRLTVDDVQFIMRRVTSLDMSASVMGVPSQTVKVADQSVDNPRIFAVDENFRTLNGFDLSLGRSISKEDEGSGANVCVIGEDLQSRLFGKESPIGKYVQLSGIALEVVGVVKKSSFLGQDNGTLLMVPLSTAQMKWVGGRRVDFALFRPKEGYPTKAAMEAVWEALMSRTGNNPLYRVDSNESILQVFNNVVGAAGVILAAIAALSLLVGGIGIMNIMLVSVTERTREIGLRKAVGAKRHDILIQFLIESATLSLVGGLIGMFIAWSIGNLVTIVTVARGWFNGAGLSAPFPIPAAIAASAFSAFIGIVFGLYPAMSAAKLDPIVALRHE